MNSKKRESQEIGKIDIRKGACPKCGSDLEVVSGVSVMCVNWQHPHMKEVYYEGGSRSCNYALLGG